MGEFCVPFISKVVQSVRKSQAISICLNCTDLRIVQHTFCKREHVSLVNIGVHCLHLFDALLFDAVDSLYGLLCVWKCYRCLQIFTKSSIYIYVTGFLVVVVFVASISVFAVDHFLLYSCDATVRVLHLKNCWKADYLFSACVHQQSGIGPLAILCSTFKWFVPLNSEF